MLTLAGFDLLNRVLRTTSIPSALENIHASLSVGADDTTPLTLDRGIGCDGTPQDTPDEISGVGLTSTSRPVRAQLGDSITVLLCAALGLDNNSVESVDWLRKVERDIDDSRNTHAEGAVATSCYSAEGVRDKIDTSPYIAPKTFTPMGAGGRYKPR